MNAEKKKKILKTKELLQNTQYPGISLEMLNFITRREKYSEMISAMSEMGLVSFIIHYGQTQVNGHNCQSNVEWYLYSDGMIPKISPILTHEMGMINFEFEKYIVKTFSECEERILFDLQGFYRTQAHRNFPWEYNFVIENQYVKSVYLKRVDMILKRMMIDNKFKEESKHEFRLRISNQVLCKLELLKSLEDEKNKVLLDKPETSESTPEWTP